MSVVPNIKYVTIRLMGNLDYYYDPSRNWCNKRSHQAGARWHCTRTKGHDGLHIAHYEGVGTSVSTAWGEVTPWTDEECIAGLWPDGV